MLNQLFAKKPLAMLLAEMRGENRLKRVLGPVGLTSMGVGAIIGTGIFVLTGVAAADKAGPAMSLSMVAAGMTCIFAALCYAEFAAMVPIAGSAYKPIEGPDHVAGQARHGGGGAQGLPQYRALPDRRWQGRRRGRAESRRGDGGLSGNADRRRVAGHRHALFVRHHRTSEGDFCGRCRSSRRRSRCRCSTSW